MPVFEFPEDHFDWADEVCEAVESGELLSPAIDTITAGVSTPSLPPDFVFRSEAVGTLYRTKTKVVVKGT